MFNKTLAMGKVVALLKDKRTLIISLDEDSDAYIPFVLPESFYDSIMSTNLASGDRISITGHFVKGTGKFCRLMADKITILNKEGGFNND